MRPTRRWTPLTAPASAFSDLAGVSLPVTVTARDAARSATAAGGFLFTHQGYSGPALLDVSHVAVRSLGDPSPARLTVRWSDRDESDWTAALRPDGSKTVGGALRAGHARSVWPPRSPGRPASIRPDLSHAFRAKNGSVSWSS